MADKSKRKRIYMLDELRGFAILCMILHHTFLDVGDVLCFSWGYKVFDALCTVQPLFWAVFIIISGICSRLSRNTIKRGFIVLGAGLIITLFTAVIMPLFGFEGSEIYFGILHCLGCSNNFKSADYFSIIPWLFVFLFGAFIGKLAKEEKFPKGMYKQRSKFLCFVGKNSLWVYILHQPAIYLVMLIIAFIIA